jgi:CheY-like chemotaxis protein
VIDDEPRMGLSLKLLLGDVNDVTTTTRAEEALEWLRSGREYEAILCDLQMPGMGGMALHAALRTEGLPAGDRVVFLTGGAVTEEAREFLRSTPNRVLQKPVPAQTLRTVIAELARQQPTAP